MRRYATRNCAVGFAVLTLIAAARGAVWVHEFPHDGNSEITKVFNNANAPNSLFAIGTTTGQASSNVTNAGGKDIFVQRRTAQTGELERATLFGGAGDEEAVSATIDLDSNRICVIGTTNSNLITEARGVDGFLLILDAESLEILESRQFGSAADDTVADVELVLGSFVVFGTGGSTAGFASGIFQYKLDATDYSQSQFKLDEEGDNFWVGIYSILFSESSGAIFVGAEMTDTVEALGATVPSQYQAFYLLRYDMETLERKNRQILSFQRLEQDIAMAPVSLDASSDYLYIAGESPGFKNPVLPSVYNPNVGVAPAIARTELDIGEWNITIFGWNRISFVNGTSNAQVTVLDATVYYFRTYHTTKFDAPTFEYNFFLRNLKLGTPDRDLMVPSNRDIFLRKAIVYKDEASGALYTGFFGDGYGKEDNFTCDGGEDRSDVIVGQILEIGGSILQTDPVGFGSRCRERFSDAIHGLDETSFIFAGTTTGSLIGNREIGDTNEVAFISASEKSPFQTATLDPVCTEVCITPTPSPTPIPTASFPPTETPQPTVSPSPSSSPSPSPTPVPTVPPVFVRGETSKQSSIGIVAGVIAGSAAVVGIASFIHYRFGEAPQEF